MGWIFGMYWIIIILLLIPVYRKGAAMVQYFWLSCWREFNICLVKEPNIFWIEIFTENSISFDEYKVIIKDKILKNYCRGYSLFSPPGIPVGLHGVPLSAKSLKIPWKSPRNFIRVYFVSNPHIFSFSPKIHGQTTIFSFNFLLNQYFYFIMSKWLDN